MKLNPKLLWDCESVSAEIRVESYLHVLFYSGCQCLSSFTLNTEHEQILLPHQPWQDVSSFSPPHSSSENHMLDSWIWWLTQYYHSEITYSVFSPVDSDSKWADLITSIIPIRSVEFSVHSAHEKSHFHFFLLSRQRRPDQVPYLVIELQSAFSFIRLNANFIDTEPRRGNN